MANNAVNEVFGHLRRVALLGDPTGQTDGKLLGRFIEERDETAFEALVRRHGPMVLGVCRRVLRNQQDAEDAFQAAFLVLVRKATSVVPRDMVGNWLYGVAQQTALRVRAMNARRRGREKQVTVMPEKAAQECRNDLQPLLDQELSRLPQKYRVAIVLCDLEGRTRKEAAQQLGWPEGSLSTRLTRGRALLARRLAKHGLACSGEALTVLLSQNSVSACLAPSLVSTTVKAATTFAAGQTAATALISAKVVAITEGVLKAMLLSKLKSMAVAAFCVCVLGMGLGASLLSGQTPGDDTQQPIERKAGGAVKTPVVNKQSQEGPKTTDLQRQLEILRNSNIQMNKRIDLLTDELMQEIKRRESQMQQFEKVLDGLTAPAAQKADKKVMRFISLGKELNPTEVAQTLKQLFNGTDQKTLRIAPSQSTYTVILQGAIEDIELAETIIHRLQDRKRELDLKLVSP